MRDLRQDEREDTNKVDMSTRKDVEVVENLEDSKVDTDLEDENVIVLEDCDIIESEEEMEEQKKFGGKSKRKNKNELVKEDFSHAIKSVEDFDKMDIREIESYGRSIQDDISGSMDEILNRSRMIDTGEIGDKLNELSVIANRTTNSFGTGLVPVIKVQKFLGRYNKVDSQLGRLADGITDYQERLNSVLDGLLQSKDILRKKISELEVCQDELSQYCKILQETDTNDGIRLQAVANRLKIISTLKATAEQSLASTVLLIKENKEISNQMEDTVTNVVPMFKMQLVNALSVKTHKEALAFKKRVGKVANELVLDNARAIKSTADEMIENRTDSIILPETIFEANKILQDTVKRVVASSTSEVDKNLEVVARIKSASNQLKTMMDGQLLDVEDDTKLLESRAEQRQMR